MSQEYPRVERRLDHKIDSLYESMGEVKADIKEIKPQITTIAKTVKQHDALLYGYKDDHGNYFPGIAGITQWLRAYVPRMFLALVAMWVVGYLTQLFRLDPQVVKQVISIFTGAP